MELLKRGTPKDGALFNLKLTTSGATGHFVYAGEVFKSMTMEGRMTVCNLSIEMGARGGMIAPDEKTFHYIKGREFTPKGDGWDKAMDYWEELYTDEGAKFDKEFFFDGSEIEPNDHLWEPIPEWGLASPKNTHAGAMEGGVATYQKSLNYMGYNEEKV